MSLLHIVSLHDAKVGAFAAPMYFRSLAEAIRTLALECASNPDLVISKSPSDFILFHLGTFDQESGTFATMIPHSLGVLSDLLSAS